jgi:hypothetical protein
MVFLTMVVLAVNLSFLGNLLCPNSAETRRDHVASSAPVNQFAVVDDKLESMSKDARKTAFQQDCLKLTRDVAQLGVLYQEQTQSERSNRLQKVLHLKHQNNLGASSISKFMELNMRCVAGRPGELEAAADKAVAFPN